MGSTKTGSVIRTPRRAAGATAVAALMVASSNSARATPVYTVTELGNLGTNTAGVTTSNAQAVNATGAAAGLAEKFSGSSDLGPRAVRWAAGSTTATELGNLGTFPAGNTNTYAWAINDAGVAVGKAAKIVSGTYVGDRAVRWDAGTTAATELGNLGTNAQGSTSFAANGINSAGVVVGEGDVYSGSTWLGHLAVRWDAGSTTPTALPNFSLASGSLGTSGANAVSSGQIVVGWAQRLGSSTSANGTLPVRWDPGSPMPTELGNLGLKNGAINGTTSGEAAKVNAAGTIVGYVLKNGDGNLGFRAVRWDAGTTTATELGNLGTDSSGFTDVFAYDINDAGIAVGQAEVFPGSILNTRAVLWNPGTTVAVDLNTLIDDSHWTLRKAAGINAAGVIVGSGLYDPDGPGPVAAQTRAFILTPVPEPAVAGVAMSVVVPATIMRRRRPPRRR